MKPYLLLAVLLSTPHITVASKYGRSVPVPLDSAFNNKGFGSYPGEASLNDLGESYPAVTFGSNGSYTSRSSGIEYLFPGYNPQPHAADNIICSGQELDVPVSDKYFSASVLLTSDLRSTVLSGNVTLLYADNTTSVSDVHANAFWWFLAIRRGELTFPYFFTHNDTNGNASHIYESHVLVERGKALTGIVLPNTTNSTTGRLHLFALSLWEAGDSGVEVQSVRPTQKWDESGHQLIELTINHSGNRCISGLKAHIDAPGITACQPAIVKRLCPGDQNRINLSIQGQANANATVFLEVPGNNRHGIIKKTFPKVKIGLEEWTSDAASLIKHEVPQWYDEAKFGIFIHWGPYSVPAWGNSTPHESYAEWFWWYSTRIKESAAADRSGFNAYRLRTFGPDLNYDDFFDNYTALSFDPKSWVDLFADAGAQYFVFTTKHHDGFANFDTGHTTNRSSLHYGPQRDLLGELFNAAEKYQPQLKRGTYFSLPEWFNPDWGKYGFTQYDKVTSTSHPGIIARNPYTSLEEPYTGRIPVNDFISDVMVPQMEILAYEYGTDIIWCDAGASNGTDGFAAKWFNWARGQDRQVAINDRCGSPWAADFDTPEYSTLSASQQRKWESNQGLDPYSYGFNRATADDEYMNATTLVRNLVDMVSKNGNLLLNVGPRADGTIHHAMVNTLREAGLWIRVHGEALYNTTYWYIASEEDDLRFTQTNDAFYILSLEQPVPGLLEVEADVPAVEGDRMAAITLQGEKEVDWGFGEQSGIWINVTQEIVDDDRLCWVFKLKYAKL